MSCSFSSGAVYIDERVHTERWIYRSAVNESKPLSDLMPEEPVTLQTNVQSLLDVCSQIYLCHSGKSFATALADLHDASTSSCRPIFAFIDIDSNTEAAALRRRGCLDSTSTLHIGNGTPPFKGFSFLSESAHAYGVQLLALLSSDLQVHDDPNLIIPVALLRSSEECSGEETDFDTAALDHVCDDSSTDNSCLILSSSQQLSLSRCLDAGAVDVICQPLDKMRVRGLMVHAYRVRRAAQKQMSRFMAVKKSRKQSWVGIHNEKPYAYLREVMVSKLMKSICNPEEVIEEFQDGDLDITPERKTYVERLVGEWDFCAHKLTEDELVYAACTMLMHAMSMPEVEHWKLTEGELRTFCLASRAAYNSFVLYHNFRHAIDVLQSVFWMLLKIGALPPMNVSHDTPSISKSPVADLITPHDALVLLISAIGHDVGHPGVNNVFLVKLNAPLAQLYNDSSVLEAFHCAAFSQILRRHWPAAFHDTGLRKLSISTILATDMGLHFKFMGRLADLQAKYRDNGDLQSWSAQDRDTYRTLMCGLIIKCADISNVARPWPIAEQWTNILQEEFAHQGEMEKEVGMETALFGGPPELGNVYKLANGQINFMSIFALPLFEGVAGLCPQLRDAVEQIKSNRSTWQGIIDRESQRDLSVPAADSDEQRSPRSLSPAKPEVPAVSTVQENDIVAREGSDVKITLDQPPDELATAPSLTTQKEVAESTVDLSQTTISGFRTGGANNDENGRSSESQSSRDGNTEGSSDATLTNHHGAHHKSGFNTSNPGSRPTSSYGVGRDTRTQSESTCGNTVATPVSPATNATSFVTLDSGDEKDNISGSGLSSTSDVYPLEDDNRPSRPSSSLGLYSVSDRNRPESSGLYLPQKPRSSDRLRELSKSHHVMSTFLENALGGRSPLSGEGASQNGANSDEPCMPHQRTIPRKKSRLRLAFWRRKLQSQQPTDDEY